MDSLTIKQAVRFWAKVKKTDSCWLWTASGNNYGYGQFWLNGTRVLAHRLIYEILVGPIPEGMHVLHKEICGACKCVNPDHLYLGTHADNMRDMRIWGNNVAGEANGRAKLTNEDVLALRCLYEHGGGTQEMLGEIFGISHQQVSKVVNRKNWEHL